MIPKSTLRTVIADQRRELDLLNDSVPRNLLQAALNYNGSSALVVKGVRRCGKSTLLKQLMKAKYPEGYHYFNFDDERAAGFQTLDFQILMEVLTEYNGEKKAALFDEIQNAAGWELFVNRLLRQGVRVHLTGSNANLLSRELGTHLTGRHVDFELYPFSFRESLRARGIEAPANGFYTTAQKALLQQAFDEYMVHGGMPEAVLHGDPSVLNGVINDIVERDIAARYGIRKPAELRAVTRFLVANAGNPITFRSIVENFNLKSPNTVQKYLGYAEEAYLLFTVQRHERKLRRLDKNPRKIYCIDNGVITRASPDTHERRGALLENTVAVHLRRLGNPFYYYKAANGAEADFIIPATQTVIQVCHRLTPENTRRETRGLIQATQETNSTNTLILTHEQETEINGTPIKPAWQWLLETEPTNTP